MKKRLNKIKDNVKIKKKKQNAIIYKKSHE